MIFLLKNILRQAREGYKILKNVKASNAWKLKMCGTDDEMRVVAARICRNYLHGTWKTVDPSQLQFRRISGGLSNFLYFVGLPEDHHALSMRTLSTSEDDSVSEISAHQGSKALITFSQRDEPKKVLIRIYGQVHGERAMDAIVTESVIFTLLSERKLGPKLYGVFSGGRIEEYINSRPLLTTELADPTLSMKIADIMSSIHSMDVPLNKEANWIWKTMYKWLNTLKQERENTEYVAKNETEQRIISRLKHLNFDAELEWLKKFLSTVDSPCVFCHNDMQEGNILLLQDDTNSSPSPYDDVHYDNPKTTQSLVHTLSMDDANTSDSECSHISDSGEPKIYIIDFEYCAYNYRGFDIANHFQEWAYDYTNPEHPYYFENQDSWPTLEQKEIFIREYLKNKHQTDEHLKVPIDAVNQLLHEVEAFALASHLFWCLWSFVNAPKSKIPFGYWEYGQSRLDTYLKLKQEVIKKGGLPQKRKICEVDI